MRRSTPRHRKRDAVEVRVSVMSYKYNRALVDQFLSSAKYVKSLPSQLGGPE
jgi:hypothetical protein